MRAILGLFLPEELKCEEELAALQKDEKTFKTELEGFEREPLFRKTYTRRKYESTCVRSIAGWFTKLPFVLACVRTNCVRSRSTISITNAAVCGWMRLGRKLAKKFSIRLRAG